MVRRLVPIVVLAAVIFAALPAQAGTLYAVANKPSGNDTLYSIDTANPTVATAVGPLGTPFTAYAFGGLEYAAELDKLFMVHRDSTNLFSINRTTGAASVVGAHGLVGPGGTGLFGLAYDPNNNWLWAVLVTATPKLYKLDPGTGAATFVANFSPSTGIDGLAYDTTLGRLVGSVGSSRKLYEINTTTGGVTLIDTYIDPTGNYNNSGLAYDKDADIFWSVESHFSYGGTGTKLVVHDLAGGGTHTEYVIASGIVGLQAIDDLAYVPDVTPVPEPGTLLLLGAGLVGLGGAAWRRRRRRRN